MRALRPPPTSSTPSAPPSPGTRAGSRRCAPTTSPPTSSALLTRNAAVAEKVDQIVFGATNQAGEDNRNVARMAGLLAGLPFEVPAVTVNRLCGSGLEAVADAVRRVWTGDADVVLAGGVESMTRAPFAFGKTDEAFIAHAAEGVRLDARLALREPEDGRALPAAVDGRDGRGRRREVEASGARSRTRSRSRRRGRRGPPSPPAAFDREIVRVPIPQKKGEPVLFAKDESPRGDVTLEGLAKLQPAFRKGGTVTRATARPSTTARRPCSS